MTGRWQRLWSREMLATWAGFGTVFIAPAFTTLVDGWIGPLTTFLVMLVVSVPVALSVSTLLPKAADALRARRSERLVGEDEADPRDAVAMTFTGSPAATNPREGRPPLLLSILKRTKPQVLFLIASPESEAQAGDVRVKVREWEDRGALSCVPQIIETITIASGDFDGARLSDRLRHEIARQKLDPRRMLIDATGGTKAMSISALLAAQELGIAVSVARQDVPKVALLQPVGENDHES